MPVSVKKEGIETSPRNGGCQLLEFPKAKSLRRTTLLGSPRLVLVNLFPLSPHVTGIQQEADPVDLPIVDKKPSFPKMCTSMSCSMFSLRSMQTPFNFCDKCLKNRS